MSGDNDAVDLDARSFNLDSVEIVDDDVDVQNELICEDRVGVDVNVEVDIDDDRSHIDNLIIPHVDEEKKNEFERQRNEILSCVPEEVKSRFGEIYFSTFGRFVGPVLIMNPYKVAPGLLRDQWLTMFRNCQKSGRENQMTHLTYWYGQYNDLPNAYSFQKTSQLISYEKGMKKTEKKLKAIHQKKDAGKKIPGKDLNFMNGFEEMEADRSKEPAERFGYIDSSFLEEYHILPGEEDDIGNQKQVKKQTTTTKNAHESKLKGKKKKIKKDEDSARMKRNALDTEKGGKPKHKKKIIKKRIKKGDSVEELSRVKKKLKNTGDDDHDSKIGKKPSVNNTKENAIDQNYSLKGSVKREEYAELGDVLSHEETDDRMLKTDELESDDDLADEDYVEMPAVRTSEKKTRKKAAKVEDRIANSKEPPKKKTQKTKIYISNEQRVLDSKKMLQKEQQKFYRCENKYLDLLRRWEGAITDKCAAQLSKIFDELLECMEQFTAPFIEEYRMSDLMKRSKGYNNEKRKMVLSKFKRIYKEKKNAVPKGFKAVKKSEKCIFIDARKDHGHSKASNAMKIEQNPRTIVNPTDSPRQTKSMPKATDPLSSKITRNVDSNGEIIPNAMLEPSLARPSKSEGNTESSSQKQTTSSSKADKKKNRFSLEKLMRAGSSSSQQGSVSTKVATLVEEPRLLSSAPSAKTTHKNPLWTIRVLSDEDISNENRSFGLEFLQQAALYIPESKTMNYEAVARNIEIAIYQWSTRNVESGSTRQNKDEGSWLNRYWNKIHDLAACISGKYEGGTLAKMICDGKFATPDELVRLSDDDLLSSFEGLPLSKF